MFLGSGGCFISNFQLKKNGWGQWAKHAVRIKMANSSFAWVSVVVKRCEHVIKEREILKCSWEDSFCSLLLKFGNNGLQQEHIFHIIISKNEKFIDPCHKVQPDAPITLCDSFGCMNICIYLVEQCMETIPSQANGLSVLMKNSCEIVLPKPISAPEGKPLRADQRLHNDILGKSTWPLICIYHTIFLLYREA